MPKNPWIAPDYSAMTPEERLEYEQTLNNDWTAPVVAPASASPASAKAPVSPVSTKKEMDPKVRDYMMNKYFPEKAANSSSVKDGASFLDKNEGTAMPASRIDSSNAASAPASEMTPEERAQKARDKAQMLQYAAAGTDLLSALMPKPQPQVFLKGWNETGKPTQTDTVNYKIDSSPFRDAAKQVKSDAREDQQIADDKVVRSDQDLARGDRDRARQADLSKQDPNSKESQAAREYLKQVAPNATTMAGFEGLSAAQVEKIAPSLYAASNAAQERKERYDDRAAQRRDNNENRALQRDMLQNNRSEKQKEMSITQAKQRGLYESGALAEDQYSKATTDTDEYDPTSSGQWIDNSSWAPNWMKNDKAIEAQAAQSAWIEAYLRDASGAAIPPNEREAYAKDFFPQPGDTPEVVANKLVLRQRKMDNARDASGANRGHGGPIAPPAKSGSTITKKPSWAK